MKRLWILGFMAVASASALAQSTIYKHVDAAGRVTYTNKPMKDAVAVELEPITTIPSTPMGVLGQPHGKPATTVAAAATPAPPAAPTAAPASATEASGIKPAVAVVSAQPSLSAASFPSVDSRTQKKRDEDRRRILEDELDREQKDLADLRKVMLQEQQNPELIAAVRLAQATADPSPSQQLELRRNLEKASGRIRGLQATAAEHEKNIEALQKELGALKP